MFNIVFLFHPLYNNLFSTRPIVAIITYMGQKVNIIMYMQIVDLRAAETKILGERLKRKPPAAIETLDNIIRGFLCTGNEAGETAFA